MASAACVFDTAIRVMSSAVRPVRLAARPMAARIPANLSAASRSAASMLSVVMGAAIGDGPATPPPQKTADALVDDQRTHRVLHLTSGFPTPPTRQAGGR